MRLSSLRKRLRRLGLAVAAGLMLAYFITPTVLRHLLRSRLQAMIAAELNAQLEIGGLSYSFPYAVDVTDAALVTPGPEGKPLELLRVGHLGLSLDRSPLHGGPLVIKTIQIDKPAIHLIKVEGGLVGRRGLVRADAPQQAPAANRMKLSQMFRLSRLSMHGGEVIYEDRTFRNTRPLVWSNLNVDLDTVPRSGSEYSFHFIADDAPLASLDALGEADIDTFLLKLSNCTVSVNVDPTRKQSALPPEYQQLMQRLGMRGALVIKTAATLPLMDLQNKKYDTTRYDTTLELRQASASLPQLPSPIDKLSAKLSLRRSSGAHALNLNFVDASSGGVMVELTGGSLVLDPDKLAWNLSGLSGRVDATSLPGGKLHGSLEFTLDGSAPLLASDIRQYSGTLHLAPHDVIARPSIFAQPIDQFTDATITLSDGLLTARQLRAGYGNDVWYVKEANVDLSGLPGQVTLRDAAGCLTFGAPRAKYPAEFEKALAAVNPSGPWFIEAKDARLGLLAPHDLDYQAHVHTARGRLAFNDGRLPIYNINTSISVTPKLIEIQTFDAGMLRGEVRLGGWMRPGEQGRYAINATVRGANLNDLMRALEKPGEKPTPLGGRGDGKLYVEGFIPNDSRPASDVLVGHGVFEVHDADFWQIPVMREIANNADVRSALTVGEAAGVFDFAHQTIHLHPATASSPLLGVEGSGDITFTGTLNLNLIATPLGKWGEKLNLGDNGIASSLLDTVQKGVNVAMQKALYNIHVAGSPNHPAVTAVPAPFITKEATDLVNFLKNQSTSGQLLDFTQRQPSAAK